MNYMIFTELYSLYSLYFFTAFEFTVQYCMCKPRLARSVDGLSFEVLGAMAAQPDTAPEPGEASHGKPMKIMKLDVPRMQHADSCSTALNRLTNDSINLL